MHHLNNIDVPAILQAVYFGLIVLVWSACMAGTVWNVRYKK